MSYLLQVLRFNYLLLGSLVTVCLICFMKDDVSEAPHRFPSKFKSAGHLNIHAVYLHILGDALGSVIVMLSALIIIFAEGDWTLYVDPAMSIIMVAIILKTSIPLLIETSKILMNSVPHHIHINDLKKRLVEMVPSVENVHELHVWQLAGEKIIGENEIVLLNKCFCFFNVLPF